jgi:glyoxylase-like metal-dependent hydrolase (beta-lactamase superfamily II)
VSFRIHALRTGTLPTPAWAVTFGVNDTTLVDLGFYVWIVTDGSTIGLVDLGLPLDAADRMSLNATNAAFGDDGFRDVRTLPELLQEASIDAEDVEFALVTQTVTYHTGGLDADLLPKATFFMAAAGVHELLGEPPGHPPREQYFTARSWSALRQLAVEGRLRLVEGEAEVVAGVVFDVTGGHHPGSAAVRVDTEDGVVGLLETSFRQTDLDAGVPIGIAEDLASCRTAIGQYRARCGRPIALHDPSNAERFPLPAPAGRPAALSTSSHPTSDKGATP